MYGKAHGLDYLLDPRCVGQGMDTDNRKWTGEHSDFYAREWLESNLFL